MNQYLIGLDDSEFHTKEDGTAWSADTKEEAIEEAERLALTGEFEKIDIETRDGDGETTCTELYYLD